MTAPRELTVLLWHVHGSWTTSFVHGPHQYLIPKLPEGAPWGLGIAGRPWPSSVREVTPAELPDTHVDVVVLQRPEEIELAQRWLARKPGLDVPAVYVEHNTPTGHAATTRHHLADRGDLPLVHVTHFNELMWDNGSAPTTVIPHGLLDPGHRYTGDLPHTAVLINEPVRRGRITGTDLLPRFGAVAPIDLFGIGAEDATSAEHRITGIGDLDQQTLHTELASRRVYLHTARWTSFGLSLIEAMLLGMPVVALATTEVARAVPSAAGAVDTDLDLLAEAVRHFQLDRHAAATAGKAGREYALTHHGLEPFLRRWDDVLGHLTEKGTR